MIFYLPNRSCYVIICLFPLWCCFGGSYERLISHFLNERPTVSEREKVKKPSGPSCCVFFSVENNFRNKRHRAALGLVLVCEGSQQECFVCSTRNWNAFDVLFIDGGSLYCLIPKSFARVCLIHLILFMAHFFASNWESKKTILLLVLLLNFNISRRYVALLGRFRFDVFFRRRNYRSSRRHP